MRYDQKINIYYKMLNLNLFRVIYVLIAIQYANCAYELQPKILTDEGCLVLETAENRNISFQLVGASTLNINNINLVNIMNEAKRQSRHYIPDSDVSLKIQFDNLQSRVFGSNGIENRVRKLENSTRNEGSRRLVSVERRVSRAQLRIRIFERKIIADNCVGEPCKNGGTCVDLFNQFLCHCSSNWQGKTCEEDVDECVYLAGTELGCQNGATCVNNQGSYQCLCVSGWVGLHCLRRKADCLSSPPDELCGHGICVHSNNEAGYNCICDQGWTTNNTIGLLREPKTCTIDVDECTAPHSPCMTTCVNTPGSFTCGPCPAGYVGNGFHCTDINECLVNNGGCSLEPRVLCINTEGSYSCGNCPIGWAGDGKTCQRLGLNMCSNNNVCHPEATCRDISNRIVCVCPKGMAGDGFGPNGCRSGVSDPCNPNPCRNGGTCMRNGSIYTCTCQVLPESQIQFSLSNNCEIQENPCSSNPCLNGATCAFNATASTFSCICPRGLSGTFCTIDRRGCGRILRATSGVLKYPNTENYDRNERCAWVIRTSSTKILNVTFSSFDLEYSKNCIFDWLQIHDGRSSAAQIIGRFCGPDMPKGGNIISTHNQLYLWFRSDNSSVHGGFELSWNSIDPVCGGIINTETYGIITSPGYPAYSPANRNCEWTLRAAFGKKLHLVFYALQLGISKSGDGDYLAILDGGSTSRQLLERYYNSTLPPPVRSQSHELTIYFSSDGNDRDSLFQLHYSVVEGIVGCGGLFTSISGEFRSPQAVDRYAQSMICEYSIQLVEGVSIKLHFTDFNLQSSSACDIESMEVFEGDSQALVWRLCGSNIPPAYTSSSNSLLIKFTSHQFILSSSFRARYQLSCGGVFQDQTGFIKSPLYPQNYLSNLNCLYSIEAPVGFAIKLVVVSFELEFSFDLSRYFEDIPSCMYDSLEIFDGFQSKQHSIGRYCSDVIPATILSTVNHMHLVFKTNEMNNYKGFSIAYSFVDIKCGGILKETSGKITSPKYSGQEIVSSSHTCRWIIVAPDGYGVSFTFTNFDLNDSLNCTDNYLQIISNSTYKEREINKFCGESSPSYITVPSNLVTLIFSSTQYSGGFDLTYNFFDERHECGGNYSMPAGSLHSPGWPSDYLSSRDCIWILSAPLGNQIELNVKSFMLESTEDCSFDFLEIRNGMTSTSPLIGVFCGQDIPKRIPSFTNHLYLHFHSDSSHNYAGFEIEWDRTSSKCGGLIESYSGSIQSPHYPDLITGLAECQWNIVVNKGSTIRIHIKQIGLPSSCLNHLYIYDGITSFGNQLQFNCSVLEESDLETTGNEALVRFKSVVNDIVGGFFLNYTINCNHELHQRYGVIESPNFPNLYPNKINCQWKIFGGKGHTIAIDVSHLNMEQFTTNTDCRFDYLEIIDIKDNETIKTERYCDTKPAPITSLGDTVKIKFHTDLYDKGSGFHLEYKVQGCGEVFSKPVGYFESPNYPYTLKAYCIWIIKTSIGHSVELTINVRLNTHDNCSSNSLTIATGPGGAYEVARYCDTESTHVITVPGHEVYVRFNSDATRTAKGMTISYKTVAASCGGVIQAPNGKIISPNFPKNYKDNLYCEWVLDFDSVAISFLTFDIESSINCTNDYVEILAIKEDADISLGRFCGTNSPKINGFENNEINNKIRVVMKTNEALTTSGFSLQYSKKCVKKINATSETGFIQKTTSQDSCTYIITNSIKSIRPDSNIVLTVLEANCDLSVSPVAKDNYFQINTFTGPLIKFCTEHPPPILINGRELVITAPTGSFAASYSLYDNTCGGNFTSARGQIASPLYPNSYPVDVECIWTIGGRHGNSIEVQFTDIHIPNSEHCSDDYLEIREGNENGKLLGLHCGEILPSSPIIGFETIWIKFRSDDKSVDKGFLASYSYVYRNEINGSKGSIESPPPGDSMSTYTWHISVSRGYVIYLYVKEYVQGLQVFDGFDETSPEIPITSESVEITSTTNVIYIMGDETLKPFILNWEGVAKKPINETNHNSCGDETLALSTTNYINISSPGYPNEYPAELNCRWIVTTIDNNNHATILFEEISLEPSYNCLSDYVEVSSSKDLVNWNSKLKICSVDDGKDLKLIHGNPYLKIDFHTDYSGSESGFQGFLKSSCGNEMTSPVGEIKGSLLTYANDVLNCSWKIRVRPGRKIQFELRFLNGRESNPHAYITLRDGIDEDSPTLGAGKYLFRNYNHSIPLTTSNRAFVQFSRYFAYISTWILSYKEISEQCDDEILLTHEINHTEITTPNYPNIPNPFTQCQWIVRAPTGESINVTFIERFDLSKAANCEKEYLEVRDGATTLSDLIGVYCTNPIQIKSTGNFLRLTFVTDTPDPRNGFKAIISIAKCGGMLVGYTGELKSLNYPSPGGYPTNSVCEYRIKVKFSYNINLTIVDLDLPFSSNASENDHLVIYPISDNDNYSDYESTRIYGNNTLSSVLFNTNQLLIKFHTFGVNFKSRGFKISFRGYYGFCGSSYKLDSGEILSPNYPNPLQRYLTCSWKITVPKGRQVKLEILDFISHPAASLHGVRTRIDFYDDFMTQSKIISINESYSDAIYSTDNYMLIRFLSYKSSSRIAFKLRYTSNSVSPCAAAHNEDTKTLTSLPLTVPFFYCEYMQTQNTNETLAIQVTTENFENTGLNCFINAPIVFVISQWIRVRRICSSASNVFAMFPFNQIKIQTNRRQFSRNMTYTMQYKRHSCGGIISGFKSGVIITKPIFDSDYGQADCAWQFGGYNGINYNLTIVSNFTNDCDKEFINIYNDPYPRNLILQRICKDSNSFNRSLVLPVFIEYHTLQYSLESNFKVDVTPKSSCGDDYEIYFHGTATVQLKKKDYQNNVECVWNIKSPIGFHIGLEFIDRFYIQQSDNCTKDYLEIRDIHGDNGVVIDRFCGRNLPPKIKSLSNYIQLLFRSDSSIVGDGFTIQLSHICGGIYNVTENIQILTSPNYPKEYYPLLECNYTLMAPKKQWIHVKLISVSLEPSETCRYDNLTVSTYFNNYEAIWDGPKVFCKISAPIEIRSHDRIDLIFKSDRYVEGTGFKFEYRIETCGGLITNSTTIKSPVDNENKYPNEMDCYWNITAPANKSTVITFKYFVMEGHKECSADYLEIYTFDNAQKDDISTLCGNLTGRTPTIKTNKINTILYAHSDAFTNWRGFSATIRFMDKCDHTVYLTDNNSTQISLNGSKDNLLDCHYKFSVPDGFQIQIQFIQFNLEFCKNCSCDVAEIRDGGQSAEILGTYCGNMLPLQITSTKNKLYMRFALISMKPDIRIAVNVSAVKSICGISEIKIDENDKNPFSIESPRINGFYPANTVCLWRLSSSQTMQIHFDNFDLQSINDNSNECSDYLEIIEDFENNDDYFGDKKTFRGRDMWREYSTLNERHKFCGNSTPADYFSQYSNIFLRFKSDSEIQHTGFKITVNHIKSCSRNYTNEGGRFASFLQGSCEIFIFAPENYTISLYFGWTWLTGRETFKFYDANTNKLINTTISETGNINPIFMNTNKVHIVMQGQADSLVNYDITHIATKAGLGCGGNINSLSGLITSPLYPSNVQNSLNCRWNIQVSQNSKIRITFSVLDMGAKINCKMDFIQFIENDSQGNEQVIRQFCGEDEPASFDSASNKLSIVYNKTIHFDGTGWIFEYQSMNKF